MTLLAFIEPQGLPWCWGGAGRRCPAQAFWTWGRSLHCTSNTIGGCTQNPGVLQQSLACHSLPESCCCWEHAGARPGTSPRRVCVGRDTNTRWGEAFLGEDHAQTGPSRACSPALLLFNPSRYKRKALEILAWLLSCCDGAHCRQTSCYSLAWPTW